MVEQRRTAGVNQFFLGGSTSGNFHIGYLSSTLIRAGKYGGINSDFFDYGIPAYTSPMPRIHTFLHSSTIGKRYWINGGVTPEGSSANTSVLTFYNGVIGHTEGTWFYNGDIAEMIIFNRALSTKERTAIEDYLGKKYAILIS